MNALVAIRALGEERRVPTAAKQAEIARASAAQQTLTKAKQATVSPTKAADATSGTSTTREINKELDRDAFLQLLVFQLQNQDPLSPTDNTQMMAQLAQFSSLEQMNNLNASFRTLSTEIDRLNFVSASSLVGRTVAGMDAQGVFTEGKVEQVYLDAENGDVYVMIGTTPVALANLQRINGTAA